MRKYFLKNTMSLFLVAGMVGVVYPPSITDSAGEESHMLNQFNTEKELPALSLHDLNPIEDESRNTEDQKESIVVKLKPATKESMRNYARMKSDEKWGVGYYDSLAWIIQKESSWRPTAQNPHSTAYGLGQFLNKTWKLVGCKKTSDPYVQIDCMIEYIDYIYDNPKKAKAFWQRKNWY